MAAPTTQEQNKAKEIEAAKEAKLEIRLVKNIEVDGDVFKVISSKCLTNVVSVFDCRDYKEFLKREIKELRDLEIESIFSDWKNKVLVLAKTLNKEYKLMKIDIFDRKVEFETELDLNVKVLTGGRFYKDFVIVFNSKEFFVVDNNGRVLEHGIIKDRDLELVDVLYLDDEDEFILICNKKVYSDDYYDETLEIYHYDRDTKEYNYLADIKLVADDVYFESAKYDSISDKLYILYYSVVFVPYSVTYYLAVFDKVDASI
jgi:hypothetical protein